MREKFLSQYPLAGTRWRNRGCRVFDHGAEVEIVKMRGGMGRIYVEILSEDGSGGAYWDATQWDFIGGHGYGVVCSSEYSVVDFHQSCLVGPLFKDVIFVETDKQPYRCTEIDLFFRVSQWAKLSGPCDGWERLLSSEVFELLAGSDQAWLYRDCHGAQYTTDYHEASLNILIDSYLTEQVKGQMQ